VTLDNGVQIRVICGEVGGKRGPVQDVVVDPQYLDVTVPAKTEFVHPIPRGYTVFAYIFDGKGIFCDQKDPYSYEEEGSNYFDLQREPMLGNHTLVVFDDGDQVKVVTEDFEVRFLLISGRPIREPVAWYGPIVMNTSEELQIAFEEYQNGTFIKHPRR
jgi:redox-sensitive bicupin YhaK (pirin superfamily)